MAPDQGGQVLPPDPLLEQGPDGEQTLHGQAVLRLGVRSEVVGVVEERVEDPAHQGVDAVLLHHGQGGLLPGEEALLLGVQGPEVVTQVPGIGEWHLVLLGQPQHLWVVFNSWS